MNGFPHVRPARPPMTTLDGLRVLIVDGELLVRWSLAEALRDQGHLVREAADAESALRIVNEWAPDVVLVDCLLPDCNDLTLLVRLCQLAPSLPIVLMTASPVDEMAARVAGLNVRDVVQKPFDVFGIERVLRRACAGKHHWWPH